MSCAVLPNSARLEKRYDATLFGFAVLTDSEMHAKRNDAARGSNGAGKPQGPWDGAKASPWAFRFPPHSLEPRSLIYWRIPWLS